MARLTRKDKNGNWHLKGVPWESLRTGAELDKATANRIYGALCKLRDYEDTGLEPAEVEYAENLYETLCAKLLERLMEEQGKHRWIPVEERLPEVGDYVLGTNKYGEVLVYHYGWNVPHSKKMFFHLCGAAANVIAWYPLPEPYRQEETKNRD